MLRHIYERAAETLHTSVILDSDIRERVDSVCPGFIITCL